MRVVDPSRLVVIEQSASVHFMPDISPRAVEEPAAFVPTGETLRSIRAMRRA